MNTVSDSRLADTGLFLVRAALAAIFIYHGGQKLFGLFGGYGIHGTAGWMASIGIPFPVLSTILAASAEFVGGIVLLLGTGARIAAIPMAFNMLVAIAMVHRTGFDARSGGMEYPLMLLVTLVAIALIGPGRFTVARALAGARPSSRHAIAPAVGSM